MKILTILILIILSLTLTGCSFKNGMTNDEVIDETKKCEEAGLKSYLIFDVWGFDIIKINCIPKTK